MYNWTVHFFDGFVVGGGVSLRVVVGLLSSLYLSTLFWFCLSLLSQKSAVCVWFVSIGADAHVCARARASLHRILLP